MNWKRIMNHAKPEKKTKKAKKVIILTGTPGTGKTSIAKELAKILNAGLIDVNKVIKKNKLDEEYDKKRKTNVVNELKLAKILQDIAKRFKNEKELNSKRKLLIIESHMSHFLPRKYVDYCFVTKCDIKELSTRLGKKGYSKAKISENIEAEIFEVCLQEALERKHNVIIVDTTGKSAGQSAGKISRIIARKVRK